MHTIVASHRSEQQQDCKFLRQRLRIRNINIVLMAIGTTFRTDSEHDFTFRLGRTTRYSKRIVVAAVKSLLFGFCNWLFRSNPTIRLALKQHSTLIRRTSESCVSL